MDAQGFTRAIKRAFDVCASIGGLFFLSPVMAMTAVVIRWKLGSPILFSQERPGWHGRLFRLYKFRTMRNATGADGKLLPDAERLTPFGQTLRSLSLDELPQFWNVLRGDMSLVGPRPLLPEYIPLYTAEQARRHDVRPGITGLAQISGRNALSWEERFRLDVRYVDEWSLWLDVKILMATVGRVISRRGVSQDNHVTMEPFRGFSSVPSDTGENECPHGK